MRKQLDYSTISIICYIVTSLFSKKSLDLTLVDVTPNKLPNLITNFVIYKLTKNPSHGCFHIVQTSPHPPSVQQQLLFTLRDTPLTPDQLKHIAHINILTVMLNTAGLRSVIEESRVWSSAVCDLAFSCSDVTQNIKKALLSDRLSFVHTDQGTKAERSSSRATRRAFAFSLATCSSTE